MTARYRYHARALKQSLRYNGRLIGCTDTVFAMIVDAATTGGMTVTERIVRGLSNETNPDPLSPGLNLAQIDAVARKLRVDFEVRTGQGWEAIELALRENRRVLAQLWYADIGGTPIGHAAYLEQVKDGKARIVDPIKGVYSWIPVADLRHAMKTFATRNGVNVGLYWGCSRPTPWLTRNQKPLEA